MHKAKRLLEGGGIGIKFLICFSISALLILILSLISAMIVAGLKDPTKSIGIFSLGAILLSAVISGVICTRVKGEGGLRFALLVALSVVLIMLLINVIICNGKVSGGAFINYGCYLSLSTLSAYIGKKGEGRRSHRH